MAFHYDFYLHFPDEEWYQVYFHALIFLNEAPVQVFCSVFVVITCFPVTEFWRFIMYFGYKFFVRNMLCKYIFPHFGVFLFIFLVSFKEQNFKFWWNAIYQCYFTDVVFSVISLPNSSSQRFSSRRFVILAFTFKSIIYLSDLCIWCKTWICLFYFYVWVSNCCTIIYWKDYPLSSELLWHLCWKSIIQICVVQFLDSILFYWSVFLYLHQHHTVLRAAFS